MTLRTPTSTNTRTKANTARRRIVRRTAADKTIAAARGAHRATGTSATDLIPASRVCHWPGRDLLTGAPLAPGADVRVLTDFEWYGPERTRQDVRVAPYGPVLYDGLSRELHNAVAHHKGFSAVAMDDPGESE